MPDIAYLALTVVGFVVLTLVVKGVEKLMSAVNIIGGVLAVGLAVFLITALLFPEKF